MATETSGSPGLGRVRRSDLPYVDLKSYGAVGDGVTDDTVAVQAALTATRLNESPIYAEETLFWPRGTYKITDGLTVGSSQHVVFEKGVVIDATGLPDETTSLFNIIAQTDVIFEGNGAELNGARATATVEGSSAAFYVAGTTRVTIQDFNISDFATDGIIITHNSGPCREVLLLNNTCDNNRRNGASIISAIGWTIFGGKYSGSTGAPSGPWAGIDVEPNADCYMQGGMIINVATEGNVGSGIQIAPGALSGVGAASTLFEVTILGGRSVNDGNYGATNKAGLLFSNGADQTNSVYGSIVVDGFQVDSPIGPGVRFRNWNADKMPHTLLDNVQVIDPDSTGVASGTLDRTGYVISCETAQTPTSLGNITLRRCQATDRRGTARMLWGFAVNADAGKTIKNVLFIDPVSTNFTDGVKVDVSVLATSGPGLMDGVDVVYSKPSPAAVTTSSALAKYVGKRIDVTASCSPTLPLAANCKGAHYEVQVATAAVNCTLTPTSGDTILWNGLPASTALVLSFGAFVSLRSIGTTYWLAEKVVGNVYRAGTSPPIATVFVTAIPTSGTFTIGDRAINRSSTVGQPKAWVRITTGSNHVLNTDWVSEGNL